MKNQTHLFISETPVHFLSGGEMLVLCDAKVRNPHPVLMLELRERGLPTFNTLRDCSKCISLAIAAAIEVPSKRYLYGITEGEGAMHSGDSLNNLTKLVDRHFEDDCA